MSVVVWDGRTLAADRQMTNCGLRAKTSKMVVTADGTVFAWTGENQHGVALVQWYLGGEIKADYPEFQKKESWTRLIVADADGCRFFENEPYAMTVHDKFAAWGSGRDFAYGALEMGADARRAVEVTITHSVECGFGVEAHDIERRTQSSAASKARPLERPVLRLVKRRNDE